MEQEEKKQPFDEWLLYARTVVRAVQNLFPKDMSVIQATIIEKALKPYHFWLEEQGLAQPQKITPHQKIFLEKILGQSSQKSKQIAKILHDAGKGLEDLTKDEASKILEEITK